MADKYRFDAGKPGDKRAGKERTQATGRQVEEARRNYPQTPEQFRHTVEQAVEYWGGREDAPEQSGRERRTGRRKKRGSAARWRRILLPAAAAAVLCCGAAAAGNFWLKPYLTERGFSGEDAEQIIVTEPEQAVTELENAVYPSGPVMEKEWEEPLLEVTEAYFDGDSLYFIGKASEESEEFELALRDHGSINGQDGLTSLEKLEDSLYLGRIELADKEAGMEILEEGTVQVEMTVMAYPRYEGRIYYAWKDADAYEEIYGTGAFTSAYAGGVCYALPQEDVIAGYTPHKITVQVAITEEAKEIIEGYIADDSLTWDTQIPTGYEEIQGEDAAETNAPESDDAAETPAENTGAQNGEEGTSVENTGAQNGEEGTSAENTGAQNGEEGTSAENAGTQNGEEGTSVEGDSDGDAAFGDAVDGSHVSCQLPGIEGVLAVEADIVQASEEVYTGVLQAEPVAIEKVLELYGGDPDTWQKITFEDGSESWQYGDQYIFASADCEGTHYEDQRIDAEAADSLAQAEAGEELAFCEALLAQLGLEGTVREQNFQAGDAKYYQAQILLEGLPIAEGSQWNGTTTLCLENGALAYVNTIADLSLLEKTEAELLEMETILERAAGYLAEGEVALDTADQPVTEISLEYYLDLTKEGLVFRPVWNFRYSSVIGEGEDAYEIDKFFYIDGETGALIRDTYGY